MKVPIFPLFRRLLTKCRIQLSVYLYMGSSPFNFIESEIFQPEEGTNKQSLSRNQVVLDVFLTIA